MKKFNIYEFLQMDLMEQNALIMDLKSRHKELGVANYIPGKSFDEFYKLGRRIQLLEELQDLQLQDAIYYDDWRDKWIIRKEFYND